MEFNMPISSSVLDEEDPQQKQLALSYAKILEEVINLKVFLVTAPASFAYGQIIRRYNLPTEEAVSCIYWNNVFYITGTDIVRCITYRFEAFGRVVRNRKKFEEGIFSDLRNLKCDSDAVLEEPKSDFLEYLYKNNCVRTQKKQKVFHWFSVSHDRLFLDALERDLKKEALGKRASTEAIGEPALSFKFDNAQTLPQQLAGIIEDIPKPLAAIAEAATSSHHMLAQHLGYEMRPTAAAAASSVVSTAPPSLESNVESNLAPNLASTITTNSTPAAIVSTAPNCSPTSSTPTLLPTSTRSTGMSRSFSNQSEHSQLVSMYSGAQHLNDSSAENINMVTQPSLSHIPVSMSAPNSTTSAPAFAPSSELSLSTSSSLASSSSIPYSTAPVAIVRRTPSESGHDVLLISNANNNMFGTTKMPSDPTFIDSLEYVNPFLQHEQELARTLKTNVDSDFPLDYFHNVTSHDCNEKGKSFERGRSAADDYLAENYRLPCQSSMGPGRAASHIIHSSNSLNDYYSSYDEVAGRHQWNSSNRQNNAMALSRVNDPKYRVDEMECLSHQNDLLSNDDSTVSNYTPASNEGDFKALLMDNKSRFRALKVDTQHCKVSKRLPNSNISFQERHYYPTPSESGTSDVTSYIKNGPDYEVTGGYPMSGSEYWSNNSYI